LEENDRQVILVKADGNPVTLPTRVTPPTRRGWTSPNPFPSSFPSRSGTGINPYGRPSGPGINPYLTPPKLVDQGLGARRNPAGAGGNGNGNGKGNGNGNGEFINNSTVPKKEQSQKSKISNQHLNNQKKKNKSAEQCELDENVEVKKIKIVDKIKESPGLTREAQKSMKNQQARRDINHLIEQLHLGNKNPGTHNKKVDGLKNVTEARGKKGGRVYFRERHGTIEILGKSNKTNQDKVVAMLQKMGY
jgi:putative component of toxin-antitoxin plasmid stabilization module